MKFNQSFYLLLYSQTPQVVTNILQMES